MSRIEGLLRELWQKGEEFEIELKEARDEIQMLNGEIRRLQDAMPRAAIVATEGVIGGRPRLYNTRLGLKWYAGVRGADRDWIRMYWPALTDEHLALLEAVYQDALDLIVGNLPGRIERLGEKVPSAASGHTTRQRWSSWCISCTNPPAPGSAQCDECADRMGKI